MQRQSPVPRENNTFSRDNAWRLRQLVGEMEAVRGMRQREYRGHPHPQLKRFTQQELNDEVCPTYKNWLVGRSNRLPSRSTLMQIADYLECSLSQRNDLLLIAQYLPETEAWEGSQFEHALASVQRTMATLPYPALIVTPTLQIQAANDFFLRLFDLSPLQAISPEQRTMLHLHFHPDFGIRSRLTMNTEAGTMWQAHGMYGLQLLKQNTRLYRNEAWYQHMVKQLCSIPDVSDYWEKAGETSAPEEAPVELFLARQPTTGEFIPIRIQQVLLSVSSHIYPAISAMFPVDEPARAVFAALGCSLSKV